MTFRLRSLILPDRAENSIMQTISIAVSAILIGAGMSIAPGIINDARDTSAKQDIAILSLAQASQFVSTDSYTNSLSVLRSATNPQLSAPSVDVRLISGNNCFASFVKSGSGNIFYGISGSRIAAEVPTPWTTVAPFGYPPDCYWPVSATNALGPTVTNYADNPGVEINAVGFSPY